MKSYLKASSWLMIFSIIFTALIIKERLVDDVIPQFSSGEIPLYLYILLFVLCAVCILKLLTAYFGITALLGDTSEASKQKKLKTAGKLAVAVLACGILTAVIKGIYGDPVLVIDVFDIAMNTLLGLMVIICSMNVRAGRE